jgi:tRNA(fMet)-specific endonuclease VapC
MPPPYLLDTDHCIAYLKKSHPAHLQVAQRIDAQPIAELRISVFTAMELAEGPFHRTTSQETQADQAILAAFLARIPNLGLSAAAVQEFGRIRAELRKSGQTIGDFDIAIAATALANKLTVVTHNTAHFSRVPSLPLEDWFP